MKNENFKTKLISRIMLLLLLLASALSFAGCGNKGLEGGFNRKGLLPSFLSAYRSDKREFDIDDVTLTFYYGGSNGIEYPSFKLYFENENGDIHLIKEVNNHDPENYIVKLEHKKILFVYKTTKIFNHSESITIPKELFVNNVGYIMFYFKNTTENLDNESEPLYLGTVVIYYKVEGDTIFLSEKSFNR